MKKIPTLFVRNPDNMKLVTRELNPECEGFFESFVVPTVKKDGTNIRITKTKDSDNFLPTPGKDNFNFSIEKRRNPTREEKALGAEPGYVDIDENNPADKHILDAIYSLNGFFFEDLPEGQYHAEALGPKIQGGVESCYPDIYLFDILPTRIVALRKYLSTNSLSFDIIKHFLCITPIEGIVFWYRSNHEDPWKYAKVKRRDFGWDWPVYHVR